MSLLYLEPIKPILEQRGCGFVLINSIDVCYWIILQYKYNPDQSGIHNHFPVELARVHKRMYAVFMLLFGIMPAMGEQMITDMALNPGETERRYMI